jgi:hypothetical protein
VTKRLEGNIEKFAGLEGNIEKLAGGKHNSLEEIETWSIYGTSFCDLSILHRLHI